MDSDSVDTTNPAKTTPSADLQSDKARRSGFFATLEAVLWSFFGVRRGDKHTQDMENLNPIHVIIVGILAAVAFVLILLAIVKAVVS